MKFKIFYIMSSVMLVVGSGLCEPVTAADQKEALVAQTMNAEESAAETNKKKPDAIVLNKVESEVENDLTLVTAKLSAQPAWKQLEVEDHGTFLQIKMPNTAIVTSGEFLDGNGPFLKKIASFQVTENDGALRLFLNQDAAKAKLATTAEILGERVVITIDHKKLEQLIQPSAPKKANSEDKLQEQAGRTPESLAPVGTKQKSKNNESMESKSSSDTVGSNVENLNLKNKLMTAAGFCAAMLLLLLASTLWRNKKIKQRMQGKASHHAEPATMKILSSLNLSSKQRLSLLQVGTQQILIGVSPENISFITEVQTKAKQSQQTAFGTHLLHADTSEVRLKQANFQSAEGSSSSVTSKTSIAKRENPQPSPTAAPRPVVRPKQVTQPSRVNYAVGDDGVSDLRNRGIKNDKGKADQPFDDITKVIRERLKNLPPNV